MLSRTERLGSSRLWLVMLAITALVIGALALAMPASAQPPDPAGNNGTVKVHDEFEAEPIVRNEPHVGCDFHFHFFFSDSGQTGDWWVRAWPPTGDRSIVLGPETYGPTNDDGEWWTRELELESGHYKLFWEGRNEQNIKHKTFWVDCQPEGGVSESTPTPTPGNGGNGGGSTPTPTPGGEGVQGGNPTPPGGEGVLGGNPTPAMGELPDTSADASRSGSVPAAVLSLTALLVLSSLIYLRGRSVLARNR